MKILILCLLLSAVFSPLSAQNEKKVTPPKVVESKMNMEIQKRISLDSGIIKAVASLENDGEFITLSEGKIRQVEGQPRAIEVVFKVKTNVKGRVLEYARVVYQSDPQGKAVVYFEGKQKVPKNNPTTPEAKSLFKKCGSWSGWMSLGTQCNSGFWCWGNQQLACFEYFRRQRDCNKNGNYWVEYDTKSEKKNCGCCK